jgi:hypothetical protein
MGLFGMFGKKHEDDDPLRPAEPSEVLGLPAVSGRQPGSDPQPGSEQHVHEVGAVEGVKNLFELMQAAGGAFNTSSVQVMGDLSHVTDEQRAKLRALGIDLDALAAGAQAMPTAFTFPGAIAAPGTTAGLGPSPAAAAADDDDTISRLERLARLREQGVLTADEFSAQKRRILGEG